MNKALEIATEIAKPFEGLVLEPYHDPVGFPTIGYGHLLSREPWADLSQWSPLTKQQAHDLLKRDMIFAYNAVMRLISVRLSDHQAAALTDFAFNCGAGNLQNSTLRRLLNQGDYESVPEQLGRWVYAAGQKLSGLVRRRTAESDCWSFNQAFLLYLQRSHNNKFAVR